VFLALDMDKRRSYVHATASPFPVETLVTTRTFAVLAGGFLCSLTALAGSAGGDAVQKELANLEGTWQLISAETDGKKLAEEQVKQIKVVIKGDRHTVYFGDQALAKQIQFRVDPGKKPKTVDDTLDDGRMIRGIYELDGDTLRSCVAAVGKDRPMEFSAKAGSGHTLRVFQRVVPKTK
jgi:uncharacterized protein (TIGR03067 family)